MELCHKLGEIDRNIQSLNHELSQTPDDHPRMPLLLSRLGKTYHKRFELLDELNDLEKAIEYKTLTLTLTPDDDPGLSELLFGLAAAHVKRFQRLGDLDDIATAIEYGHISVDLTSDGNSAIVIRLATIGTFHSIRFEKLGELSDLEEAIQYQSRALALTPDGHPHLPVILANLGTSHKHRFERLGELSDLDNAIEYEFRALALTPDGHPQLPGRLGNLGTSHAHRFKRLGELSDLENAIEYQSHALALTPDGHPHLPGMLANLGTSHAHRFERLSKLSDLENAIEYQSRALALTPDGHPHLPDMLANLGASHMHRFKRLGELSDLDNAIAYESRALALTPDGHPHFPVMLANLGISHKHRFERLGELSDLENAIEYESRALVLTPDGHPHFPGRLADHGISHTHRFERLGELSDLENAIEYKSHALALTPDGHPQLPGMLANLGVSHGDRFQRLGELSDLEHAIEYQSRALVLTPEGHPDLPIRLGNLGASHRHRFEHLGKLSDLENEIEYESRALSLTPDDHPGTSRRQFNLATSHLLYYQRTTDHSHLQHSLALFRSASQALSGAPRDRFKIAQTWAIKAYMHNPDSCIEAYQTVIDLLPQFIWLGATTNQRYEDLLMTEALAASAASAAIRFADCNLALEWLEHARCVVWNQSLMLRSPLEDLHSRDSDLGTQLRTVAEQLHSASSYSRESRAFASGSMTPEQVAQEHRRLAKQYEDLLAQIRKLPGFDDFLRPVKAKGLIQAARTGPVVVISCHEDNCDALLVLPGQQTVGHVPLPGFSAHKAQQARQTLEGSLRYKGIRERGVTVRQEPGQKDGMPSMLTTLWYDVVKPILDHLGYMVSASLPHITWCPTGALSFLPLHAAGDYDQSQSRVFDYVISSYTPTLTALLASRLDLSSNSCRILAIGQANTPGHSSLPGTARELKCVQNHAQNHAQYSQLIDSQATVPAVLNAMEQHDWVHLACHAHQNARDPTRSGFFLYEGTLDLAEINRRSFKGKGLAFLSACQTATGDADWLTKRYTSRREC
ncbi:aromatic di-alanine and TPR containing protein [Rhizoctonia solani 123E]|uniref:Aromatic di-alanine and TPR containing protein n=1 Tax=Rhizoctonia solani 123E TaxID=1423351 RepID=A0A074RGV1_9AGAM|nr:aromatic di-alanine and TPR containing protein [Rhizoctonia solani 123E]